jgi:hypothetical protein
MPAPAGRYDVVMHRAPHPTKSPRGRALMSSPALAALNPAMIPVAPIRATVAAALTWSMLPAALTLALLPAGCSRQPGTAASAVMPTAPPAAVPGQPAAAGDRRVAPFLVVTTPEVDGAIVPREFMEPTTEDGKFARSLVPDLGADGYWTPSLDDVTAAQQRVRAAMFAAAQGEVAGVFGDGPVPDRRAAAPQAIRDIVAAWSDYRTQYLGLVVKGRKRILCNVFPKADAVGNAGGRWQHWWVLNDRGGTAYWQITWDVADDACLGFDFNPES